MRPENQSENQEDTGEIQTALDSVGSYLSALANEAVVNRVWVEDRWLEDMRQLEELDVTVEHPHNITKPKTLTAEARIGDMLFQQGDKNFSVTPDENTPPDQRDAAEQASDALERNIVNKLDDSDYETVGRKCIKYATQIGVGVIQGPVASMDMEKFWVQKPDPSPENPGKVINVLTLKQTKKPRVEHVETWNYFPDMSAATQEDCAYEFRRRFMTKSQLQKLLLREDFNKQAILDIINTEPTSSPPRYLTELRDDNLPQTTAENYIIWEGYATVPKEMISALCGECGKEKGNHFVEEDVIDENFDMEVHAWVSDSGKMLKLSPTPLETEERGFSVFCYDRDTSCFMASKGVPRLLRTTQRDINHSWERIHDNSDLAVGPQWVVDTSLVEPLPEDGKELSWEMTGNKGWRSLKPGADMSKAFYTFNIPSGIEEMMAILHQSIKFADTETQLPQIASGEQSAEMTKTFHGMELLVNASNTIQRRIIKDWDDYVSVPLIGRFIDYCMQHDPQPEITGRFVPKAQGTSSLLLKETLTRNALNIAQIAMNNPKFAERTDWEGLYNQIIRGLQYDPDVVTYTQEEIDKKRKENPPQPDAKQIEAQANMIEAKNETSKIATNNQVEKWKHESTMRELSLKEKKAKADTNIKMIELQIKQEEAKRGNQGKILEKMIDGKVKAESEKMKAANDREKIVLETKGKESLQNSEFILEGQREDSQVNKT